ncbi:nitric oxide reductase subunit B [Legionella lansingensis]|uniref:Nitric oxide reductase subunit B n=1 Tax=Legionella lansingensis TaxID=45067 RepID=A0A0W0VL23_9GAMM|nr:cbb3-type cytochrome c oxidase subunit I [Legionella lansingensis]KTD20810.1 nitric oxide reductase subunit B [Legionella lansingensis]SNV49833.1 nitric oxide reductase subunit B [Legionella lansingensis]
MQTTIKSNGNTEETSPWWRRAVLITMAIGFSILLLLTTKVYQDAPPIPEKVMNPQGNVLFGKKNIMAGQAVFLKYGLMDNGSVWGHGAYLGPDFSANYLHNLTQTMDKTISEKQYQRAFDQLNEEEQTIVRSLTRSALKKNRYDPQTGRLIYTEGEAVSYHNQIDWWARYFAKSSGNGGLPANFITKGDELNDLVAFFAWTAWASVTNRPGQSVTYTNNFPYDPQAGNLPSGAATFWSAISLIALLGGTALVLLAFGKFDYLGWKRSKEKILPRFKIGQPTSSQRATIKFFVIVMFLFLAQTLVGGLTAHYRAEPGDFYGYDISEIFPSNVVRTWHLQLAIFWIATSYVAGALLLSRELGGREAKYQTQLIHLLFTALFIVVVGSLLGEWAGTFQWLGKYWFWFGQQGWEYLELGRVWQIGLAIGLVFWLVLLVRNIIPVLNDPELSEISRLFFFAALAIPLFYLPAMFFDSATHFSIVDTWRFWIIHLWVEGFFEFFVTVLVALILMGLGVVTRATGTRVIYLDAILYFGGGVVGTGHHWYFNGHSEANMALSAIFSAMEVIPLTLLTLDAWDFIRVTEMERLPSGEHVHIPHKWTFYFIMAVGFWNFVGAGVFGFLINLPIVSYFEIGTMLTPNHGHAAMMGVFGMLAMALLVFSIRHVSSDSQWHKLEKYVKISFIGLNLGLFLMLVSSLFPGGVLQLLDVLNNGYWHARSLDYTGQKSARLIEWLRTPADLIFIVFGVVPLMIAVIRCYLNTRTTSYS